MFSSKTFCVTAEPLQDCGTKHFLEDPTRAEKHKLGFPIGQGKTSSHEIVSHHGFPQHKSVILCLFKLCFPCKQHSKDTWRVNELHVV